MSLLVRIFQRTYVDFSAVSVVVGHLNEQTARLLDLEAVVRLGVLDQVARFRDSFLQVDEVLRGLNGKIDNSAHIFLRVHVNQHLALNAVKFLEFLL